MGLLFAILSALFYVLLDVLRKLLGRRLSAPLIAVGINLGAGLVYGAMLLLSGGSSWDQVFVILASIEAVTHAVASLLFVQAVILSPLSLTIPYLGFTPVVSTGVAAVVLGEIPSLQGLAGIGLVVIGAVALHAGQDISIRALLTAPLREPGSWRMLVVAGIWGTTTSLDKIAIAHGSEILLAFCLATGSAILLALASRLGVLSDDDEAENQQADMRALLLLAGAAVVAGGAVLCQFFAYRELFVAYVETIKRSGSLLSLLIGAVVFGETGLMQRLPAAALMTVGVAFIALH